MSGLIGCVHPTTIHKAIKNGEKSTVKGWLLNEDTKANEYRGGRAFSRHHAVANGTALHWAVYYGQLEIAQLLLENGAGICNLGNQQALVQDLVFYPLVQTTMYKVVEEKVSIVDAWKRTFRLNAPVVIRTKVTLISP